MLGKNLLQMTVPGLSAIPPNVHEPRDKFGRLKIK
jgi:hypothetical protein